MQKIDTATYDTLLRSDKHQQGNETRTEKTKNRLRELLCLYQIATVLGDKMELDNAFRVAKRTILKNFEIDQFSAFFLDPVSQKLQLRSWSGFKKPVGQQACFQPAENIFSETLRNGTVTYIEKMKPGDNTKYYYALENATGSFLCLPLVSRATKDPLGTINLYRKMEEGFSQEEISTLQNICKQIAHVIDKIIAFQQIKELSITDELTQIYNRRYFNQCLEREFMRSQRYQRPMTVLMVDIDHFKVYNDTNGHLAGDKTLFKVAQSLRESLRKADIVARFGGEEFVILLPETDKLHGLKVAEKLVRVIAGKKYERADILPFGKLTISLGIASYPSDGSTSKELLKTADEALYAAKAKGRNQVGTQKSEKQKQPETRSEYNRRMADARF